jgi:hypothetical protein
MRRTAPVLALVLSALLGGCGSSHSATTPEIGGNPPAPFSEDLNSVCQQGETSHGTTTEAYSERRSVREFEQYVRKFRALTAPQGHGAAYASFVGGFERAIRDFEEGTPGSAILAAEGGEAYATQLGAPACERVVYTGGY